MQAISSDITSTAGPNAPASLGTFHHGSAQAGSKQLENGQPSFDLVFEESDAGMEADKNESVGAAEEQDQNEHTVKWTETGTEADDADAGFDAGEAGFKLPAPSSDTDFTIADPSVVTADEDADVDATSPSLPNSTADTGLAAAGQNAEAARFPSKMSSPGSTSNAGWQFSGGTSHPDVGHGGHIEKSLKQLRPGQADRPRIERDVSSEVIGQNIQIAARVKGAESQSSDALPVQPDLTGKNNEAGITLRANRNVVINDAAREAVQQSSTQYTVEHGGSGKLTAPLYAAAAPSHPQKVESVSRLEAGATGRIALEGQRVEASAVAQQMSATSMTPVQSAPSGAIPISEQIAHRPLPAADVEPFGTSRNHTNPAASVPKPPATVPTSTAFNIAQTSGAITSYDPKLSMLDVSQDLLPATPVEAGSPQYMGTTPHVTRTDLLPQLTRQLAEVVQHMPQRPVEITLSPEELGRVRLSVSAAETAVTVTILAERPETLDLMRRNIDQLTRDFQQMGYDSIAFSFGERQGDGNEQGHSRAFEKDEPANNASNDTAAPASPSRARLRAASGLDLRM